MSTSYDRYLEDLAEKRAPAERKAEQLLREGNFADAEATITAVDRSIYGGVAAAKMYRRYMEADNYESGRAKDRAELVGILGCDPGDA